MDGILGIIVTGLGILLFLVIVYFAIIAMFYKKVHQGQALVRTGFGGTKVATDKGLVCRTSFPPCGDYGYFS